MTPLVGGRVLPYPVSRTPFTIYRVHERPEAGYTSPVEHPTHEQDQTDDRAATRRGRLGRAALVVLDMQEAYFEAPALRDHRETIVERCSVAIAWARSLGLPIITVRTEHRADRSTWTLNMLEDDQGMLIEGDDHTVALEELDLRGAVEVVKARDDAFLGTTLEQVLSDLSVEALVLTGVSTHTCITLTAAHAFAVQLEVVLVRDAIASHRPELHDITLDTLRLEYRCPVLEAESLHRLSLR